jgi:hypothetical protein
MSKRVSTPMVKVKDFIAIADVVFIPRKMRSDHGTETVEIYCVHLLSLRRVYSKTSLFQDEFI